MGSGRCAHEDVRVLEAVVFDFDAPCGASERDAHMFRDLIWSLHCADIRIAVTAAGRRTRSSHWSATSSATVSSRC